MVESFANLHVLGVTIDGKVWHTRRSPTGWTPFALVPTPAGQRAIDVACVRRIPVPPETAPNTQGLWVLIAYESSPPQLWSRADTGQWLAIPQGVLPLPTSRRVALTVSSGVAPDNDPQNPGGARAYVHLAVVADGVTAQDRGRIIAAVLPNQGAGGGTSALAEVQTSGAGDLGAADSVALAPVDLFREGPGLPESAALLAAAFTDGALFFTQGAVEWGLGSGGPAAWSPFRAWDLGPPGGPGARPGEVVALAQGQPDPAVTRSPTVTSLSTSRLRHFTGALSGL